jgi:hypothetical protein
VLPNYQSGSQLESFEFMVTDPSYLTLPPFFDVPYFMVIVD